MIAETVESGVKANNFTFSALFTDPITCWKVTSVLRC